MAISAFAIWDVRVGGDDTNGAGAFDPSVVATGGFTDGAATVATGNSPVFTSASYNFVAGDVGAWLFISSGTNWTPGWYQIASVGANAATLSAAIGAAYLMLNKAATGFNTVAGCATTASPTGATWAIDRSQQLAAVYTYTDLASVGAGLLVSSVAHPFGKQEVGNSIVVTGGTNFTAGRYVIASVSVGLVATVTGPANITTGVGASGTGGLGGCLATPGQAGAVKVLGNDVFILYNASDYTLASASSNVAGGIVTDSSGATDTTNQSYWVGWATSRYRFNTDANRPTLNFGSQVSVTMFTASGQHVSVHNIIVNGNSQTGSKGFAFTAQSGTAWRCQGNNCLNSGFARSGNSALIDFCSATGCSTQPAFIASAGTGVPFSFCEAYANTITGFSIFTGSTAFKCLSYLNSGGSSDGFVGIAEMFLAGCVAQGNGRNGFNCPSSTRNSAFWNCVATDNGAEGWSSAGVRDGLMLFNCAGRNNTSGNYSTTNVTSVFGFITLTADPFMDAANGDFRLNATAGGGVLLKETGYPSTLPRGTTANFADVGVAQHHAVAGASSLVNSSGLVG